MEGAYQVVVVGAGPNGLAAAITCARAGLSVALLEAKSTVGGGARSAERTLPGFVHDICSAIHPFALVSPFFLNIPLADQGLSWASPEVPLAHPLDGGGAAALCRSFEETATTLGRDAPAYERIMRPLVSRALELYSDALSPLGPFAIPHHPLLLARFGLFGMQSTIGLSNRTFRDAPAKALLAGLGAHSFQPLDRPFTAAFSLMLGVAGHAVGWPCARGGSQAISDAAARYLRSLGGTILTDRLVGSMADVPKADAYLFDVFPHALATIAGSLLPETYKRRLLAYRHAPGVFKVDWALAGPIPWINLVVRRAGTVHLGGTLEEVAAGEKAVSEGRHAERPYVLLAQQSVMDDSRAPPGQHTGWAYCHVPWSSTVDQTNAIESQVERFAPGFRALVLARSVMTSADYASYNPNYEGGDIAGGATDFGQLFARPVATPVPYATPAKNVFLCSASTPPGGGVHGMCGYHAARVALHRVFKKRTFLEERADHHGAHR